MQTASKKIIVFGASNSSKSINRQFAQYAAQQLDGVEITLWDLNDYEMPLYSIDREESNGFPEQVADIVAQIKETDGLLISLAEHNGSYTVAFKNIIDWVSRAQSNAFAQKPMLLLATSPGARGGKGVLEAASDRLPRLGASLVATFSLPSFKENFDAATGITNTDLAAEFQAALQKFAEAL